MRLLVATVGSEPENEGMRQVFLDLAREDAVGEHPVEADPDRADALLFVDLQQYLGDPFPRALRHHELVRAFPEKVFVYDERDLAFFTFPGIYVAPMPRLARRRAILGGPYPWLPNAPAVSTEDPDLLFSFRGSRTHPIRNDVLTLRHARALVEDAGDINFFAVRDAASDARFERARVTYGEMILRSKFVLCPRGRGPASFRLYEALAAERVPVIISDDWLPPPRVDWNRCAVRVAERDVHAIPRLLEEREGNWPELVAGGREAIAKQLGRSRLWHHYATSLTALRHAARRHLAPWWAQPEVLRLHASRIKAAIARRGPA
jgi:exostosin family protein